MFGRAGAPSAVDSFMPLYSGGLCEAVKLIPHAAFCDRIAWETVGVGVGPLQRRASNPRFATQRAHSAAKSSPIKRVSCATIIERFSGKTPQNSEQMASVTRPTFAKMNSSATTARHPDVPNRIVMRFGLRDCLT